MGEQLCSTCRAPATHRIVDASEEKGNLSCKPCLRRFWPFADAVPISSDD